MPKMTFIERDGTRREVDAPLGMSVLEIARRHDIDIEGAGEGWLACSTCHVIVDRNGRVVTRRARTRRMLDLAFNPTATSWLGFRDRPQRGAGRFDGGACRGGRNLPLG